MSAQDFVAQLQGHLQAIVGSGDSAQIRTSTAALSQSFYNQAQCVPALMQIMCTADSSPLRQMAAVELRKRTQKWWPQVDEPTQTSIKQTLLDFALAEEEQRVRHAVARVITSVAKVEVPAGKWNELLQYLYSSCQSAKVGHREVGYYVIYTLLDVVAELFTQHLAHLIALFQQGLNDPESKEVKTSTLKALSGLAELIEPTDDASIKAYRKLIPSMVAVLQQFLDAGMEDEIAAGIEVFDNLITIDTPLISKHVADLIQFFLGVGANMQYPENVRVNALTFLMWAAIYKKNKIVRLKLVHPIVQGLMQIGCEDDPEDSDEDSPSRLAFRAMHTIAMNVPPQHIFPFVWENASKFMQQPTGGFRKAAMMSLATMTEGCSDYIRNEFKLDNFVPAIAQGLKDADIAVRRGACVALASLASDMGEEVAEFHATLLPLVFELLTPENESIRKETLETLDTLLECLGDNIRPYLVPLMEKLVVLLDCSDNEVKLTITSAIGSAAHAAEKDFQPFFPHVIARIQSFMALSNKADEDEMALRGAATDAAAAIAVAVGKDMFAPHLQPMMELAMASVQISEQRLAECGFCFFGIMAKVFGDDFSPFLPVVVERLFHSCQVQEVEDSGSADGEAEDFNVDDDDENAYLNNYAINNAIAEEKETAVEALGMIFEHCSRHFGTQLERLVQIVQELCDHTHDGVRKACLGTFFKMVTTLWTVYHGELEWSAGLPTTYTVHQNVLHMIKIVMDESMKTYDEEEEKQVVFTLNSEITDALKVMGPVLVSGHMEALAQHVLNLLEKQAPCQAEFDTEFGDDEDAEAAVNEDAEMDAEYDGMVISTTADLIGGLAQAVGEPFAVYFKAYWPHILKYYKPSRPVSDRSMAVGVLGEVTSGLKAEITPYTEQMLAMVVTALDDEDDEVRSNAVYACGMICRYSSVDLAGHYPALLMKLSPLFHDQDLANVTDNACGAVCRMIIARPHAVPLDQVLPVLFRALPLKKDFAENEPVLECLHGLFQAKNAVVVQNLPVLFPVLAQVLADGKQMEVMTKATRAHLESLIKGTAGVADASAMQSMVAGLASELQGAVLPMLR